MAGHVVLGGFMATGKTSLAPVVAERAGLPWIDLDSIIAARFGEPVAEVWQRLGERAFRELEAEIMAFELRSGVAKVIACGGGSLLDRRTRHLALDSGIVVTLTAPVATIVARAGSASSRPNLAAIDPAARAAELLAARAEAYAECHASLATDEASLDELADRVLAVRARRPIAVPLGLRSYVVDIARDAPWALTDALARLAPSRLVVVTDALVYRAQRERLESALGPLAVEGTLVTLAPGEANKNLAAISTIWDAALGAEVDRDAVLLAFGGVWWEISRDSRRRRCCGAFGWRRLRRPFLPWSTRRSEGKQGSICPRARTWSGRFTSRAQWWSISARSPRFRAASCARVSPRS